MLSWIRTSTSLITFGFGVHQVFRIASSADAHTRAAVPYLFGSAMVGIGLVVLVVAVLANRRTQRHLATEYPAARGYPVAPPSHAGLLAALIGGLGIGAMILMHVGP
ncbi:DUF202 domain-containing protein [Neotabrizicola shimadae]|uniref:DUF202 domain-containing protein n=1 Tax=Neotabrizicola shimadae TaxID=2807096 RepID=A0A8G0ZWI9_9RHOB|nr:DUF202 domain-containing protein [Neotabrizicola shimadae]